MTEWTTDVNFEEQVQLSSLENMKSNGISVRMGAQIVKFVLSEVQDIDIEGEIRAELMASYTQEYNKLKEQFSTFKSMVQDQVNQKNREIDRRERDLKEQLRKNTALPTISEDISRKGLMVAKRSGSGYLWSMVSVYAPRYMNNKNIDPKFANRLISPIRILMYTDDSWKITEVRLVKLINCDKFEHYHSMSSGKDCWGQMKFQGQVVDTPEKALAMFKDVQLVIESINRSSIANRAPKGLPRLATLEKYLTTDRRDPENDKRSTAARRNERTGIDEEAMTEVSETLWDATA